MQDLGEFPWRSNRMGPSIQDTSPPSYCEPKIDSCKKKRERPPLDHDGHETGGGGVWQGSMEPYNHETACRPENHPAACWNCLQIYENAKNPGCHLRRSDPYESCCDSENGHHNLVVLGAAEQPTLFLVKWEIWEELDSTPVSPNVVEWL